MDISELHMVIYNLGVCWGYGHVSEILTFFSDKAVSVGFEARSQDEKNVDIVSLCHIQGGQAMIFPKCVAESNGPVTFRVNTHQSSSSIFPPSEETMDWHVEYTHCRTWRENTELDYTVAMDAISIKEVVEGGMPPPDILSMDIQGLELAVMRGCADIVAEHTLAVISEVNFAALYQGQSLFCEQFSFLRERNFHFVDFIGAQHWHRGPVAGNGFLTVSEGIFLRNYEEFVPAAEKGERAALIKLCKLAMISLFFYQFSYAYTIVKYLLARHADAVRPIFQDRHYADLPKLYMFMEAHLEDYERDPTFFQGKINLRPPFDSFRAKIATIR